MVVFVGNEVKLGRKFSVFVVCSSGLVCIVFDVVRVILLCCVLILVF